MEPIMSSNSIYSVYQILNTVNQKVYIGITTKQNPIVRWSEHLSQHLKVDYVLYKAMRKYGVDKFHFSILEQTNNIETLKQLESKYIQECNSYCFQENSNGYNMTLGGDGKWGAPSSMKGKTFSEETRRKMSVAKKGKTFSEEHRRKLSEVNKGRTLSEETRRKMSVAKKEKSRGLFSEEHKRKMSEAHKGHTHSKETKQKMSQSLKGRVFSEETKRKLREAWKRRKEESLV
jgi:group I intron endonuclease